MSALTAEHKKALAAGRRRKQTEDRKAAIARVDAYERWLKRGSVLRQIPPIPTDADYRKARDAGRV
jgi:hypothetical protein